MFVQAGSLKDSAASALLSPLKDSRVLRGNLVFHFKQHKALQKASALVYSLNKEPRKVDKLEKWRYHRSTCRYDKENCQHDTTPEKPPWRIKKPAPGSTSALGPASCSNLGVKHTAR